MCWGTKFHPCYCRQTHYIINLSRSTLVFSIQPVLKGHDFPYQGQILSHFSMIAHLSCCELSLHMPLISSLTHPCVNPVHQDLSTIPSTFCTSSQKADISDNSLACFANPSILTFWSTVPNIQPQIFLACWKRSKSIH